MNHLFIDDHGVVIYILSSLDLNDCLLYNHLGLLWWHATYVLCSILLIPFLLRIKMLILRRSSGVCFVLVLLENQQLVSPTSLKTG